jgi:hypothetical protein
MNTIRSSLVFAFLCLALLVGSAFAAIPPTELLYVQQGQNIITYSVNTTTAVTKKLSTLRTAYNGATKITINRSGSFLYLLGFSPAIEYFTVYSLTTAGVPNPKPVQTLVVKPALKQFLIHPNGTLAYALFWWTEILDGTYEVASDVALFTVNPKTGKITNTTKPAANFPMNDSWSTTMFGMDSKGRKLYLESQYIGPGHKGFDYLDAPIDAKTGVLGSQVDFWNENRNEHSVFSDSLTALTHPNLFILINPNLSNPNAPRTFFSCSSSMVVICGDNNHRLWMHPSGAYIFVADQTLNEVTILYISLPLQKLEESHAGLQSIPGIPAEVAFSPDGLLVYAQEDSEILVYVFNPHSGVLTAKTAIKAPGVLSILPWR